MRIFSLFVVLCFSISAWSATTDNTTTMDISTSVERETPFSMEPSFTFSSINGGSRFMGVALTTRLTSWLRVGVEGELPADFDERAQIYSGRLLARVPLLDRDNKIYLQGSVSFSYFNAPVNGDPDFTEFSADTFYNSEFLIGYSRKLSQEWALGAMIGVQYSTIDSYVFNEYSNNETFYNRASITGSYIF